MLSCCKSEPKRSKQQSYESPKLQYKYSFKQRSHVLVNSQAGSSPTSAYDDYQISHYLGPKDDHYLTHEYDRLKKQQRNLELTIANHLRPLENEVNIYQAEVKTRQNEIRELAQLLDVVLRNRKLNQQKISRMSSAQPLPRPNPLQYR